MDNAPETNNENHNRGTRSDSHSVTENNDNATTTEVSIEPMIDPNVVTLTQLKDLPIEQVNIDTQSVINQIDKLCQNKGSIESNEWGDILFPANLSDTDIDKVLEYLVLKGVGKKRALNKEWEKYKQAQAQQQATCCLNKNQKFRIPIEWIETNMNGMVQQAEDAILAVPGSFEYLHNGSLYIYIKYTKPNNCFAIDDKQKSPPETALFVPYDGPAMLLRTEQSCQFYTEREDGPEEIPVPEKLVKLLLNNPMVRTPIVHGLVSHSVVLPSGEVQYQHGYNNNSQLYLNAKNVSFPKPIQQKLEKEACALILASVATTVFDEVEFANDIDKAVALTMLFTGVQRKLLDLSPFFVTTAHIQGSGKTTLLRIIYIILTGQDMPVTRFTTGDSTEQKKEMVAYLLSQIEMICVDNEPDGSMIENPILSQITTSSEFEGRVLGYSKNARLKTNVMIAYTGNNLTICKDLARRALTCYLEPTEERPELRKFKHSDVVAYNRSIRVDVLHAVTTIIRSYLLSGDKIDITSSGFSQWDELVRKPLIWAGLPDPIECWDRTRKESPEIQAPIALLDALYDFFEGSEFTSSDIVRSLDINNNTSGKMNEQRKLIQIIDEYYSVKNCNARSIGKILSKMLGNRSNGKYLSKRISGGISQYTVNT